MLDQLKRMAMQQLASKMAGNSLGATETQNAAESGANGLMETIKGALMGGGGIDSIKDMLSGDSAEGLGGFQFATKTTNIILRYPTRPLADSWFNSIYK